MCYIYLLPENNNTFPSEKNIFESNISIILLKGFDVTSCRGMNQLKIVHLR